MKKTLLILKHELIYTITRRTFLFTAFGLPIFSALIFGAIGALNRNAPQAMDAVLGAGAQEVSAPEGYVDMAGFIKTIPDEVPEGRLVRFPDESAARQALEANNISAFYILPQDYLQTGKVTYIRPDFNPITGSGQTGLMQWVVQVNLLEGDVERVGRLNNPMDTQVELLAPRQDRDESNPLSFILPYGTTMVYYFVILMSATLLLNSVTREKENRVIEILMSAITPRQLLFGKVLGLGLAGMAQTVAWVGTAFALLRLSGGTFDIPAQFQLPVSFLVWGVVFFLLGYFLYASLMAAVGAMVPNLREASQATFIVIAPMIVPLLFINTLIDQPHGRLSTILSLFPLTAPTTMMSRLASGGVPLWQPFLSAVLLGLTGIFVIRSVAALFRAQTLLSGQPFAFKRLLTVLSGRA